eukprot:scaffold17610_cov27-Tisochrysis_lutea.AAC.2
MSPRERSVTRRLGLGRGCVPLVALGIQEQQANDVRGSSCRTQRYVAGPARVIEGTGGRLSTRGCVRNSSILIERQ